jgi:DNA-binding NtrC family response regulator
MKKILIADDEPTILLTLSHLLAGTQTAVVTNSGINEARATLSRHTFDLVITDISFTGAFGLEGLELLSHVKNVTPDTEVIVMTAHGSEEKRQDAYRRGAYHYYEKPIDIHDLISKIQSLGIAVPSPQEKKGKDQGLCSSEAEFGWAV